MSKIVELPTMISSVYDSSRPASMSSQNAFLRARDEINGKTKEDVLGPKLPMFEMKIPSDPSSACLVEDDDSGRCHFSQVHNKLNKLDSLILIREEQSQHHNTNGDTAMSSFNRRPLDSFIDSQVDDITSNYLFRINTNQVDDMNTIRKAVDIICNQKITDFAIIEQAIERDCLKS